MFRDIFLQIVRMHTLSKSMHRTLTCTLAAPLLMALIDVVLFVVWFKFAKNESTSWIILRIIWWLSSIHLRMLFRCSRYLNINSWWLFGNVFKYISVVLTRFIAYSLNWKENISDLNVWKIWKWHEVCIAQAQGITLDYRCFSFLLHLPTDQSQVPSKYQIVLNYIWWRSVGRWWNLWQLRRYPTRSKWRKHRDRTTAIQNPTNQPYQHFHQYFIRKSYL